MLKQEAAAPGAELKPTIVDLNQQLAAELEKVAAEGRKPKVNKAAAKKKVGECGPGTRQQHGLEAGVAGACSDTWATVW